MAQADADAVDAAVGAGQDFEAEAVFFYDFAGEGDVAGDLGDEAAEGGGFVVLGEAEGGGVVAGVAGGLRVGLVWIEVAQGVVAVAKVAGADAAEVVLLGGVGGVGFGGFFGLRFVRGAADCGLVLVGEEVAEAGEFEGAGDDVGAVGLADGGVVGFGFVVLVGDVAYDGFEEIFDGDEAGYAAVLVDDDAHVLLFALHLAEELGYFFGLGDEGGGALDLGDGAGVGFGVGDLEKVVGEGDAGDVVEGTGVDGDAGEGVFVDLGGELAEGEVAGDGEDLGARGHDLEDDLVAELYGGADEFAIGLFEDALFFAGFEEGVHGFGGMVFFGCVFGLCQRGDGEEQLQQHGDGQDEIEERLQDGQDADDPEAAGAGEEELGQEAVEDQDEEDELAGGANDLSGAWSTDERGNESGLGVEAEAGEQREGDQGELAQDGSGESDGFAAEAEAGFDDSLPRVDVVLVFAGEELAHLEVDTIDVGGQGEDGEEEEERESVGVCGGHPRPRLGVFVLLRLAERTRRDVFFVVLGEVFLVLDGFLDRDVVVRSIRVAGRRSSRRRVASRAAISPLSVSWSSPERWSRPCSRRTLTSSGSGWP